MASVLPPPITYSPKIPQSTITDGDLSDAQLEAVVYAGASHEKFLGDGSRRGFFIGDGTGVGKGREIAGVVLDNVGHGRPKHIWLSEKWPLFEDAKRDFTGVGGDAGQLFSMKSTKQTDDLPKRNGVLFSTYDTIRTGIEGGKPKPKKEGEKKPAKRTRIEQIVDWLGGPDEAAKFDGVVAFDESHNMGNGQTTKGKRGNKDASLKALAGIALQEALPNARILYVSATGATEVANLGYLKRLGLWGQGSAFPTMDSFISAVSNAGVAGMELVARDLKAMGLYTARSLSFEGVKYDRLEHKLTANQIQTYDELARAWQMVLQNIHAALAHTAKNDKGKVDGRAKASALSKFWGSHQRFFNQVITSMAMPSVLAATERDIAAGKAVVMSLVNTMEASTERQLAKIESEEDLENLDLTPREALMQYVEGAFPVAQMEEQHDPETGNVSMRPVYDAAGNPVLNPEAVAMRDELLDKLGSIRVPDGPLEILLNHFGTNKVAEVTGRSRRVVRLPSGKTEVQKRGGKANAAEVAAFQGDKKQILVFSAAGGTSASYHADAKAKNKRERQHYPIQVGWRADQAVQALGRTHRANEVQPPAYHLVSTDLPGHRRFISTVARRLDQLGALSKGQRNTGGQGLFSELDNLESSHAKDALRAFFRDLAHGKYPEIPLKVFEAETGLSLLANDGSLREDLPEMAQFLNRLLSMTVGMQNKTFDAYFEKLQANIELAIAAGTLDVGVENLRADKIEKTGEQTVYTEPESGAETKHVKLDVHRKNEILPFPERGDIRFIENKRSGHIYAVDPKSVTSTDADGNIHVKYRLVDPGGTKYLDKDDLTIDKPDRREDEGRFVGPINPVDARPKWEAQAKALPEFRTTEMHLITGAVLPIWDRLPSDEGVKVFRVVTTKGERMLGRVIPPGYVKETLARLGANAGSVTLSPEDAFRRVIDDRWQLSLSNGWTIGRRLVGGEDRAEVTGPDWQDWKGELMPAGVLSERIGYGGTRYFIPNAEVLAKILKNKPIADATPPKGAGLHDFIEAPSILQAQAATRAVLRDELNGERATPEDVAEIARRARAEIQRGLGAAGGPARGEEAGAAPERGEHPARGAVQGARVQLPETTDRGPGGDQRGAATASAEAGVPGGPGRPVAAERGVTGNPAFKKWFGESKVVDERGSPLVVYKAMHPYDWTKEGETGGAPEIESINRTTEFPSFNGDEPGVKIAGFFGDKETANRFAKGNASPAIYPVFLSLQNPHVIDARGKAAAEIEFGESGRPFRDAIRGENYDGVIIKNTRDEGTVYVALRPEQIKSAIGNRGTFDPKDSRLHFFSANPKPAPTEETEEKPGPRAVPAPPGPPPTSSPLPKVSKVFAPPFPEEKLARVGALEMRSMLGELAHRADVEHKALEAWEHYFDAPGRRELREDDELEMIAKDWENQGRAEDAKALRDHAEQVEFMQRMDEGRPQLSLTLSGPAKYLKQAFDGRKDELIKHGLEAAKSWREFYFPHIWDLTKDEKGPGVIARIMGRRPLEGTKSHQKKRVFPTVMDGIRAGYVPVDWNPIRLSWLKLHEMDRCIGAWKLLESVHALNLPVYVRAMTKMPEGYSTPNDPIFRVYKSPLIDVKEAVDPELMAGFKKVADALGTTISTKMSLGRATSGGRTRWGSSSESGDEIVRRFGGAEEIVAHELGHSMDTKLGLLDQLRKGDEKTVDRELGRLADLRAEGLPDDDPKTDRYRAYIHQPDERIANLVHAVVNVPDLVQEYAPTTWGKLHDLAGTEPAVEQLLAVKRSVRLETHQGAVHAGGVVQAGAWALPTPVTDIINTHLAPSLLAGKKGIGRKLFHLYRLSANAMLMARLGWSGFHPAFTTNNAVLSKLSLAGTNAARGNLGGALKAIEQIPSGAAAGFMANPVVREWYAPGTQGEGVAAIVKYLEMGGGRAKQSRLNDLGGWENFFRELRKVGLGNEGGGLQMAADVARHPVAAGGVVAKHPLVTLKAAIETGTRYIMHTYVPNIKLAASADLAARDLAEFMKESGAKSFKEVLEQTDPIRLKDRAARVVDTMDDRMGQVVWENYFIDKTLRDVISATVQSPGWQFGTWRHIGGAVIDALKGAVRGVGHVFGQDWGKPETDVRGRALPAINDRMAYTILLPFYTALMNTFIQLAYTGERPKDLKDLVFPRNGRTNPDGTPMRLSPATYMRNIAALLGGFVGPTGSLWHGIGQAATAASHMTNSMLSTMLEWAKNEDFYGTQIIDKNAPPAEQLADMLRFLLKSFESYSYQGMKKEHQAGTPWLETAPAYFGLPPASAQLSRSPLMQELIEYERDHRSAAPRTKEQTEKSDLKREIRAARMRGDEEAEAEAEQRAREGGMFTPKDLRKLSSSKIAESSMVQGFKSLPLPDAIKIFKMGSPEEKAALIPVMRHKIANKSGLDAVPLQKRVDYLREARGLVESGR